MSNKSLNEAEQGIVDMYINKGNLLDESPKNGTTLLDDCTLLLVLRGWSAVEARTYLKDAKAKSAGNPA